MSKRYAKIKKNIFIPSFLFENPHYCRHPLVLCALLSSRARPRPHSRPLPPKTAPTSTRVLMAPQKACSSHLFQRGLGRSCRCHAHPFPIPPPCVRICSSTRNELAALVRRHHRHLNICGGGRGRGRMFSFIGKASKHAQIN